MRRWKKSCVATYEDATCGVIYFALDCKKTYQVAMAVTNDMSADRRVMRHAATLRGAGYAVTVVHRAESGERRVESGEWRTENGELAAARGALSTLHSPFSVLRSPLSTPHTRGWRFYAEYNIALWRRLLQLKPNAVWANDTDTLPGCWLAARRLHCPLVMDAHELFPEVPEIQHKPLVKWVWRTLERMLMPRCNALLTVCQSVADYYKREYGLEFKVVRNISEECGMRNEKLNVPAANSPRLTPHSSLKTLLYQGSVNLGRGVDWAIDALEYLPQCRLVVAGKGDLLEQMKAYAASKPWADRIQFLGQVPPDELPALTRQADVGLVMLEDMGLSYHYALPNRIGDFVAAGVPMVVSDLPEMAAVVRRFGVGEIISNEECGMKNDELAGAPTKPSLALARAVERVLAREWTEADFAEARKDMDWNNEKQKLLEICFTTFC